MVCETMSAVKGDITLLQVDAIVNAAHPSLLGGGGVDGAIHEAAGPELLSHCDTLDGCSPGDAKITPGYLLPATWVIHAVGPVWRGGGDGEPEMLSGCYLRSMELAAERQLDSIAFPCISTGVYGYPPELAAPLAVQAVSQSPHRVRQVVFCCFSDEDLRLYEALLPR